VEDVIIWQPEVRYQFTFSIHCALHWLVILKKIWFFEEKKKCNPMQKKTLHLFNQTKNFSSALEG
jgi:hypothetical protein